MSDNKMRPEDLPMWLPLREGCEWDSIFNIHECFDPEYDTLPLALLRLAFWVFAVSPRFLWWLLMLYHFRRLINTSRAVVFLQAATAAALCLIPWIWQSDYSRLRSQTEPFFADCWQLWFLLSSPNILFSAYHLPGTIRDGIVLARDYAYRCMDLEILFPEPGEVNLDAVPRDTDGEAFFKKLLAEDREMRRRRESEEQAKREHELAMREREREMREREAVRQKELEDRRRQRARREEEARQEEQRRGYDPDAPSSLAAIFRRTASRWRPFVPKPEPELELARVKVQGPGSKGSRKVIAFYSRGTQTEPRDFPGERASGEATSSRYTSNGVQTESEEKQHKAPASKPQEKAASSPARDPQSSSTPTPAPESPVVKQTDDDDEPAEKPQPPGSTSPRPSAPKASASRQHVRSLFGERASTNLHGRHPRSHVRARRRLGRGRPGVLSGSRGGGRVDESPSESLESSTRGGAQEEEEAETAAADPIPFVPEDAPSTTCLPFSRPEGFDDFEEWLNSPLPPSAFDGAEPTTTTSSQDLPVSPDDGDDDMAFGDLLGSALRKMGADDSAEVRSTSDLMDLDYVQDPEETTAGEVQLATEMEIVVDDSGVASPLPMFSPEMDWEAEGGPDIVMGDDAPPAPSTTLPLVLPAALALAPSIAALDPSTAFTPSTTPAAPTPSPVLPTPSPALPTPSPALPTPAPEPTPSPKDTRASATSPPAAPEDTDKSQEELDELERDLIAAFENDSSDAETVLHGPPNPPAAPGPDQPQEASQEELSQRRILKPRSRKPKDTGSASSFSRQTSLQSSEKEEQAQDKAVMDNTAQNLVLLAGLTDIPIGDSTPMTDSPKEMTPIQTPTRRDSAPTASSKDLSEAELQRAIRRQQAKKGKKPSLFHSKRSNASSSAAAAPSPTPSTRSTNTPKEAESSDASAERLLSRTNSKKQVRVVSSSSVPQNLRDQERDKDSAERESLRRGDY